MGARGNITTEHANGYNMYGDQLTGSRASGSISMNQWGMLTATVEYTAPEWVPANATVTLTVPVRYYRCV